MYESETTKRIEPRYTLAAAREAGYRVLERLEDDMALQSVPASTPAPVAERAMGPATPRMIPVPPA